uniref:Solute carrier family 25 member 44 n=2 Tax=Salvator merianae TaxID=96440 RepID=A0A8D0DVQ5_SALMN
MPQLLPPARLFCLPSLSRIMTSRPVDGSRGRDGVRGAARGLAEAAGSSAPSRRPIGRSRTGGLRRRKDPDEAEAGAFPGRALRTWQALGTQHERAGNGSFVQNPSCATCSIKGASAMEDKRNIQIIEWEHLDKKKFYVFGVCMTMMIRVSVYPFTLIRTRLQVQKGKSLYNGTFDAFVKILRAEGAAGLYRGFLVNTFTLISGQCYVTTYELTRKYTSRYTNSNTIKSVVAGGSASLVAQSITVPIDVVSQHLMMQRKGETMGRFKVQAHEGRRFPVFGQTRDIIAQIFKADGLRGFYRGYVASLLTYIPNSAVWWPFYHFYAEQLSSLTPKDCPHLLLQAISGPMAAATASTLTNPMDVIRARVQVEGKSSIILTFKQLLAEEGPWGLTKGLSARIISATPSTIVIVVGYETLKKLSLRPELVDSRHW